MKKTVDISWTSSAAWGVLVLLSGLLLNSCEAAFIDGSLGRGGGMPVGAFVSIWDITTKTGAMNDNKIELPLVDGGNYNFTVDWDDGSSDRITSWNAEEATHTYDAAKEYTVTITGTFEGWRFIEDLNRPATTLLNSDNIGDADKFVNVIQWGNMKLGNFDSHFAGAKNLKGFSAKDKPDLSKTTSLKNAFHNASSFNGDISNWDVSSVEDMSYMFANAKAFNQDISGWNVSSVTDMNYMFARASKFNNGAAVDETNRPLTWNEKVKNVTNMSNMFFGAEKFNQDISGWNVSKVTNMSNMFTQAWAFNQDISAWNVGMVTNMSQMFANAKAFNQDISGWELNDTTSITNMFSSTTHLCNNSSWLPQKSGASAQDFGCP